MFIAILFFLSMLSCKQSKPVVYHALDSLIVSNDEPGEPLVIRGQVTNAEGKAQDSVHVYLYQTDAKGIYSSDGPRNPRIKANLLTDSKGVFAFKTIWPGSYPNSNTPRHIHFAIKKHGRAEKKIEVVFENDPLLSDEFKKMNPSVTPISLTKDSVGVFFGKINFVMD